jgi:hypothetical protein
VEAVVNSFAEAHKPLPVVNQRQQERAAVKQLIAAQLDRATAKRVRALLKEPEPTLREAYEYFASENPLDPALLDTFKMASHLRSKAVHGQTVHVDQQQASDARRLLGSMLRTELGIHELVRWEPGARFLGARIIQKFTFPGPNTGNMPETKEPDASSSLPDEPAG